MLDLNLTGKVAIVTGAGRLRGIGRATAVELASLGADVMVTGTGRDPATFPDDEKAIGWRDIESTAEQVRSHGVRCLPLRVDVNNAADVQQVVDVTLNEFGRIDILINNAALGRGDDRKPLVDVDEMLFRRVLEVKVVGSFLFTKSVIRVLLDQDEGGRIVNLSSIAGKQSGPFTAAYAAANAGIEAMTRSLAREVARHNITVNAVCPGPIDTARMDVIPRGEVWDRFIASRVPLGRAGTDEEVGGLIAFLCTEAASWMTGQSINIDGGVVMEH